jgi:hypothetical protein
MANSAYFRRARRWMTPRERRVSALAGGPIAPGQLVRLNAEGRVEAWSPSDHAFIYGAAAHSAVKGEEVLVVVGGRSAGV